MQFQSLSMKETMTVTCISERTSRSLLLYTSCCNLSGHPVHSRFHFRQHREMHTPQNTACVWCTRTKISRFELKAPFYIRVTGPPRALWTRANSDVLFGGTMRNPSFFRVSRPLPPRKRKKSGIKRNPESKTILSETAPLLRLISRAFVYAFADLSSWDDGVFFFNSFVILLVLSYITMSLKDE